MLTKEKTPYIDRNKKEIFTGDVVKYHKITCGSDEIYIVIRRDYDKLNVGKVSKFGLHRQGFFKPCCAGCWDYTELAKEDYNYIIKMWKKATEEVKSQYNGFDDYADQYCVEIVGNIFDGVPDGKFEWDIDPQYKKEVAIPSSVKTEGIIANDL